MPLRENCVIVVCRLPENRAVLKTVGMLPKVRCHYLYAPVFFSPFKQHVCSRRTSASLAWVTDAAGSPRPARIRVREASESSRTGPDPSQGNGLPCSCSWFLGKELPCGCSFCLGEKLPCSCSWFLERFLERSKNQPCLDLVQIRLP